MFVHRSNRTDVLVDRLAEVVNTPLSDPTAPECIVVQGRGMERWLSAELARRFGVWANPDFPFPRALIERVIHVVMGTEAAVSAAFAPDALLWAVAALIPTLRRHPEFAPIDGYLTADPTTTRADDVCGGRVLQLARRIASTFDQYVLYRPDLVASWEAGAPGGWQAELWRALVAEHGAGHIAAPAREVCARLRRGNVSFDGFAKRVSLFGLSTLPPLYVELLSALAQHVELHLFLLSPSREYWGEIRSRREALREVLRLGGALTPSDEHLGQIEGNPLLASLGRVGRDFQQVLESRVDYQDDDNDLYEEPGTDSVLATLHSDVLHLVQRRAAAPGDEPGPGWAAPLPLRPDDRSLTVHACHSPMREVEVLYDQLLDLFQNDPTLGPHEVIVMSPAIDTYAPLVEAVFGAPGTTTRIPFTIADRQVRATADVVDAFLTLLRTLRGRLAAPDVVDLLERRPIAVRFGMSEEDLELIRGWVRESGIRWGADAAHRQDEQQPALAENTWTFGLDRLLLGYAMPGENRRLFGGVLPYDDVEGTAAEALGKLCQFCSELFAFRASLQAARPVPQWRDDLGRLLSRLTDSGGTAWEQPTEILSALNELAQHADTVAFATPVTLDALVPLLEARLERGAPGRGFLIGGVTFCALLPMRSIPFRVVCLLGLSDDQFPRRRRPLGFDLMARSPRPGDPSVRDDDRYLFLEALLSARERLIITYQGHSIRDNTPLPPSVVVSDLLDVIDASFEPPQQGTSKQASDALVVRHPLQAFSRRYFDGSDPRLFSYAARARDAAAARLGAADARGGFVETPLPPDAERERVVSIDQLTRFFDNPAKAFLTQRLRLRLEVEEDTLADREPLELAGLDRWEVGTEVITRALAGEPLPGVFDALRAAGSLPPGVLGEAEYAALAAQADDIRRAVVGEFGGEALRPVDVSLEVAGTRVVGALRQVWPAAQVQWAFAKLTARHKLRAWIWHLVLNCAHTAHYPLMSVLIGRGKPDQVDTVRLRPLADAAATLGALLRLYWIGQTAPLPLFGDTSYAFVAAERTRKLVPSAVTVPSAIRNRFDEDEGAGGANPYVARVFDRVDPLDLRHAVVGLDVRGAGTERVPLRFGDVARAVFGPLLDHLSGNEGPAVEPAGHRAEGTD